MNSDGLGGIGMTSDRTRERLAGRLGDAGIRSVHVLNVIRHIPRHLFVDEALATRAYEDTALPIGHGQTISQPFVVARMTEIVIRHGMPERVLEIGTGSGYQAAVLSALVGQVYTVERIRALHERSRELFRRLGLTNIRSRLADGHEGWSTSGPYDAILVTAATPTIPDALFDQLKEGGELLAPVGGEVQELRIYRRQDGRLVEEGIEPVTFVPMRPGVQ